MQAACKEAARLIASQQQKLQAKQSDITAFQLAGADVAARQRIFDMGTKIVNSILLDSDIQPWEVSHRLEEAKYSVLETVSKAGLFRNDVSGRLCIVSIEDTDKYPLLVAMQDKVP